MDRKYIVTQLRRCPSCKLLFRTPTDKPFHNQSFYEREYVQGFTTDLPSDAELSSLTSSNFKGTEKDYSYYIDILRQLGLMPGSKIFDFGCSWGYGSAQLAQAGFHVLAFELAEPRRRFASQKLRVSVVDDMQSAMLDYESKFDCFFSAHVLEHVPSPSSVLEYARKLLSSNGLFVSFTPNGSEAHRHCSKGWSKMWGEVHPNFIDDVFLDSSFNGSPRVVGSSPLKRVLLPQTPELVRLDELAGDELFFAAQKTGNHWVYH
jgi:SAM-dependent methyltransferase